MVDNKIGRVYGNLTIVSFSHRDNNKIYWNFICTCGTMVTRRLDACGESCGCLNRKYGDEIYTKEYEAWNGIKARCLNKKHKRYKYYGGRGISICNSWLSSYHDFLSDIGRAPTPKHSLDRINVNGNYEPSNCRWATQKEQTNNTRANRVIEYHGIKLTLAQWCEKLKLNYKRTHQRICRNNWPIEKAFQLCD